MKLTEKAAYLKGLVEGLGIDESTKEGKVIKAMCELLGEMADAVHELDEDLEDAYDEINDLSDELENLEADLYENEESDGTDGGDSEDEDDDDTAEGADEPFYEVACPNCGETVYVSEADLDAGEAICPSCKAEFEVALAGDDDETDDGPARYEVTCPNCGQTSEFEEDALLNGEAVCPNCGKPLDVEPEEK